MADLGKKYCVNCLADVTNLRIRCAECQDIELCPECFSAGAEIGNHRRWHGYQQVDGGRFSLWGPEAEGGWTSREEQSLLDAIEQYGFGGVGGIGGAVGLGGGTSIIPTGSLGSSVAATPKRKITKEEKEQRTKLRTLCQFMPQREFEEFFDNMHKERMLRVKVRELQRYRRNGITRLDESAEYEAARHKREKRKENKSIAGSKRGSSGGGGAAGFGGGVGAGGGLGGGGGVSAIKEEGKDSEFSAIENLSGFELLSDREKVLCNSMNLSPTRYLTVKTIIIKDHLQKRQGIPSKSRLPSYLDKVLKKRILNFLSESGWISREAS
ncbi:transcriptional adapter 2-beta-like [Sinocyclocheilus grahami]|uniref:transcriptional adapter 2-beta-like n=1 Tax=Sinocyclocheilus grahami TaxID=75366 RepID=UPI0007ACDE72|nr:PREDICTED: transcriptional adapter 2-beta-like [Sinocyclocheilus grahami]